MVVEFVKGQAQSFVATRDFALNFEDRKIPSVKIREGETVQYDGQVAIYTKSDGDIAKGRCPGLKSAINMMGWLEPFVGEVEVEEQIADVPEVPESTPQLEEGSLFEEEPVAEDPLGEPAAVIDPSPESKEFDDLKGGNFEEFAHKDGDTHVVGSRGMEVIKEDDLIVKEVGPIKNTTEQKRKGKLEVAGDQVEVRTVSSSTVTPRTIKKGNFEVVEGDQFGADTTIPLRTKTAASTSEPQKKSYVVDDTTPRPTEGMSRDEIQRITKPKIINADESQDAKVVRKIAPTMEVKEVEGVTLRKTESPKDMTFKKTKTPDGMTVTTKVGSGSTGVADVSQQGGVVVKTIGGEGKGKAPAIEPQEAVEVGKVGAEKPPKPVETGEKTGDELIKDLFEDMTPEEVELQKKKKIESDKRAKDRAAKRKIASSETQKMVEKEAGIVPKEEVPVEKEVKEVPVPEKVESGDFLSMLPDDWGKLHWVKKEKFIKELTDIDFIKFIFTVETTKAVKNACTERLKELEQTG